MHKIALVALSILPLFAGFFPAPVHTSIAEVEKGEISLQHAFPVNGMSGVVIHDYGDGIQAITHHLVQTQSEGTAHTLDTEIIHHNALPTIKTAIEPDDKVIGGYLYNNVLLLAPNAQTYAKITAHDTKNWIHPDLYAMFLSQKGEAIPTRSNLKAFAKEYQVGLIYIVRKHSSILLDPISGKIVSKKTQEILETTTKFPFFMHFDSLQTGWFSTRSKGDFYQTMETNCFELAPLIYDPLQKYDENHLM